MITQLPPSILLKLSVFEAPVAQSDRKDHTGAVTWIWDDMNQWQGRFRLPTWQRFVDWGPADSDGLFKLYDLRTSRTFIPSFRRQLQIEQNTSREPTNHRKQSAAQSFLFDQCEFSEDVCVCVVLKNLSALCDRHVTRNTWTVDIRTATASSPVALCSF